MGNFFLRIYHFWRSIVEHFIEVNGLSRASDLAYQTLLSMVPMLAVSLGVVGALPAFKTSVVKIETFLFNNLTVVSDTQIHEYIQGFTQHAVNLSATGLVFLIVTAVLMIMTMESSLNAIFGVKKQRRGVNAFLIYWAVLTMLPILGGAALALSVYVASLPYIVDTFDIINTWVPLLDLLPMVLLWLAFSMLYLTLPNCKVLFRHAIAGGLVAAIFFEVGKRGFSYYAHNFSSYTFIYGALAALPILLVWIYWSWVITLFGAAVAAKLGESR
jgi:membrane protein